MKKGQIVFFIILVILTLFLIGLIYFTDKTEVNEVNLASLNQNLITDTLSQAELTAKYQENLKKLFEDFLSAKSFMASDQKGQNLALETFQNNLLSLVVPAKYRQLHLDLVIAINKLKNQKTDELAASRQALTEQIDQNNWLNPFLSLFIINLY